MDDAIAKLKDKGYRVTPARRALLRTLSEATNPHTIPELAKHTESDEASVYRNIDVFSKEHIVEAINLADSLPRYALAHGHHHHIVCTHCAFVAHIPCGTQHDTPSHKQFVSITSHEVTYYGLCKNCASY